MESAGLTGRLRTGIRNLTGFIRLERYCCLGAVAVVVVRLIYILIIAFHTDFAPFHAIYYKVLPAAFRIHDNPPDILREPGAGYYSTVANKILDGDFLPKYDKENFILPPGYPFLLAGIYRVFGRNNLYAVLGVYAVFDVLILLLLIHFFRRASLAEKDRKELIFSLVFACYLPYVSVVLYPKTEGLYFLLITAFLLLFQRTFERFNVKSTILSGMVLGCAALTRPLTLVFPAWLLLWRMLFPYKDSRKTEMIKHGILTGVMLLIVIPWVAGISAKYNRFIMISGYATRTVASAKDDGSGDVSITDQVQKKNKFNFSFSYARLITNNITAPFRQPFKTLKAYCIKFVRLWFHLLKKGQIRPSVGSWVTAFLQLVVLVGAVTGIARSGILRTGLLLPLLLEGCLVTFHVMIFSDLTRYVMPFIPVLLFICVSVAEYILPDSGNRRIPANQAIQ